MSSVSGADADPIVRFYRLEAPDACGRMLSEIWEWDHDRLEDVHDYIQWLFPLRTRSAFNADAPLVTDVTIEVFQRGEMLRRHLERSFELMLDFYGLQLRSRGGGDDDVVVECGPSFATRSRRWLLPNDHNHNHNHLRITRILTSVRILGLWANGQALHDCLERIAAHHPERISTTTLDFWANAAGRTRNRRWSKTNPAG
jgi:hypothetical protein